MKTVSLRNGATNAASGGQLMKNFSTRALLSAKPAISRINIPRDELLLQLGRKRKQ